MKKKEKLLSQLLVYAGKRKVLTYLSMVIAGLSQLLALAPFLYIWLILRDVIAGNYSRIAHYGWMAVAFAIASIVVYFGGLMCSHVAAFRIAANMRKTLMQHIMSLPIGFLDTLGSGKVRKWVQESTQSTETYLAHQLPDKAGMYATMLGLAVLMFLFDWRMGLLCLGTVLLAIIVMVTLMTGPTLKQKMGEYNKALDSMSNEAVEYVRGIIGYHRLTVLGGDVSIPFGNFVFRGEAADNIDDDGHHQGSVLGGLDWYPGADWNLSVQFNHVWQSGGVPSSFATLRISKALLNNSLTLSTFAYAGVHDGGVFNRLSADWAASDQIHALLGYDFFYAEKGMFARYAHNDEVWIKLKYNF